MGILRLFKKKKCKAKCAAPIQIETKSATLNIGVSQSSTQTCSLGNGSSDIEEMNKLEYRGINSGSNIDVIITTSTSAIEDENDPQGIEISFSSKDAVIGNMKSNTYLVALNEDEDGEDRDDPTLLSHQLDDDCSLFTDNDSDEILDEDNDTSHDDDSGESCGSEDSRSDIASSSESDSSLQAFYRYMTCIPIAKTNRSHDRKSLVDDVSTVGSNSVSSESVDKNIMEHLSSAFSVKTYKYDMKGLDVTDTLSSEAFFLAKPGMERSTTEETVKIRNRLVLR